MQHFIHFLLLPSKNDVFLALLVHIYIAIIHFLWRFSSTQDYLLHRIYNVNVQIE